MKKSKLDTKTPLYILYRSFTTSPEWVAIFSDTDPEMIKFYLTIEKNNLPYAKYKIEKY